MKRNENLILGKFVDLAEIEKAYINLERHFTKKCQLIKELEKRLEDLENFNNTGETNELGINARSFVPEIEKEDKEESQDKLQKQNIENIQPYDSQSKPFNTDGNKENMREIKSAHNDELEAVKRFVNAYPCSKACFEGIERAMDGKEITYDNLAASYISVLESRITDQKELIKDRNFLEEYVFNNDEIKGVIIVEYLNSLQKNAVPMSVKGGGTVFNVLLPSKPKDLKSASELAKNILLNKE